MCSSCERYALVEKRQGLPQSRTQARFDRFRESLHFKPPRQHKRADSFLSALWQMFARMLLSLDAIETLLIGRGGIQVGHHRATGRH